MKAINYGALSGFRMVRLGQEDLWDVGGGSDGVTNSNGTDYTDENFTPDINPAPAKSPAPAAQDSSPGFFQQVGGFFSSLFTPSNISAAAKIVRGTPAAPKPGAVLPPAAASASAFSDPGTLLILGGITVAAVVGVSLLTRKSD